MALNGVLLVAVVILYGLHFSATKGASNGDGATTQDPTDSPKKAEGQVGGARIAYFNIDSLSTYYDFQADKLAELEDKTSKIQRRLQSKEQKLSEAFQSAQSRAQAGLLSENALMQEQQKLAQMEQELKKDQFQASQGINTENMEVTKEIYNRITQFLKEFNADGRFDFIAQHSDMPGGGIFLYKNEAMDITDEVIKGLNAAYKAEKGE